MSKLVRSGMPPWTPWTPISKLLEFWILVFPHQTTPRTRTQTLWKRESEHPTLKRVPGTTLKVRSGTILIYSSFFSRELSAMKTPFWCLSLNNNDNYFKIKHHNTTFTELYWTVTDPPLIRHWTAVFYHWSVHLSSQEERYISLSKEMYGSVVKHNSSVADQWQFSTVQWKWYYDA